MPQGYVLFSMVADLYTTSVTVLVLTNTMVMAETVVLAKIHGGGQNDVVAV